MAKPNYRVLTLDTSVARTAEKIIPTGEGFDAVEILSMPGGLTPFMSFDGTTDATHLVPMVAGQQRRFVDECNNPFLATEGLVLSHNAVVGNLVILLSQGVTH